MIVPTKIPLTLTSMGVEMSLQMDKVGKATTQSLILTIQENNAVMCF